MKPASFNVWEFVKIRALGYKNRDLFYSVRLEIFYCLSQNNRFQILIFFLWSPADFS